MKHAEFSIPRLATTILACALLSGCASSRNGDLLGSFEDITAGYTKTGWKANQVRTMSVNGQLPFLDIGDAYYFKPHRGNLAAIGLSFEVQDFTNSTEKIQTFASGASVNDLVELRAKVLFVAEAAAAVVKAEAGIRSNTDTNAAAVEALRDEVKKANAGLNEASRTAIGALSQQNVMIFRWQAKDDSTFSFLAGEAARAKLRREMGRSGFVLVAGLRSRTLVLSQLDGNRLQAVDNRTFPLGCDSLLTDWWPTVYGSGIYVVSHLLEAQKLAYVSEASLAKAVELHAKYSRGMKLKDIDTVALDLAISSISSLANAGIVVPTETSNQFVSIGRSDCSACRHADTPHPAKCAVCKQQEELKKNRTGGAPHKHGDTENHVHAGESSVWTPIMAVTTRLRDLDELFNAVKPINAVK